VNQKSESNQLVRPGPLLVLLSIALVVFYLAISLVVSVNQRWFIYVPPIYSTWNIERMATMAKLQRWKNAAGEKIGMQRPAPVQPARGRVLVLYGNGSCTLNSTHYAEDIQKVGNLDVYILEYPGYADRPGAPSQSSLFAAADDALATLGTNQPVYLVGESLGSGVAAHLAGTFPDRVGGVLLVSPFNRLTGVAQFHMPLLPVGLILADRYPSEDFLKKYHGPVGITVDGRDNVVPERFGRALYDHYAGPKHLWSFPSGTHITIVEPADKFWSEVLALWQLPATR
jgi:uncharacterized protein